MSKNTITLIDQSDIPASFGCVSLFVNNQHVLESHDYEQQPVETVAQKLADALDSEVDTIYISHKELAEHIAEKQGSLDELKAKLIEGEIEPEDIYDQWCQNYRNDDLISFLQSARTN